MQAESVAKSSTVKKIQTVYTEVMEITKVFGENLRLFRESLGLSAEDFGTSLGVTGKHIYDIEKGRKKPSMDVIEKIEEKHKVAASDLFKREALPQKQLSVSDSLKLALRVPDRIYELANKLDLDNDVWDAVEGLLEDEIEYGQKEKGKAKA